MARKPDTRLGCKKSKWKDKDLKFMLPARLSVRDLLNLGQYLPARIDQGQIGSCTGAAKVQYDYGFAKLNSVTSKIGTKARFSIWWGYNGARAIEGTLGEDAGAELRDVLDWNRKMGNLPDQFWPYPDGCTKLDKTSPPSKFNSEAAKWPLPNYSPVAQLKGFYRITGGAEGIFQALEAAQQAIEAGKPRHLFVYMGTPWWDCWMDTDSKGYLKVPTSRNYVAGYHAWLYYAGEYKRGLLHMVNTWGSGWGTYQLGMTSGQKGCAIMPAECIDLMKVEGGYDAFVYEVEGGNWGAGPEPTPTPEPPSPTALPYFILGSKDGKAWQGFNTTTGKYLL